MPAHLIRPNTYKVEYSGWAPHDNWGVLWWMAVLLPPCTLIRLKRSTALLLPQNGLTSSLRTPDLKIFYGGACPQTLHDYVHTIISALPNLKYLPPHQYDESLNHVEQLNGQCQSVQKLCTRLFPLRDDAKMQFSVTQLQVHLFTHSFTTSSTHMHTNGPT